jgi:hypothetical protein
MQVCPRCGTEVDDDAAFCPSCGQALAAPAQAPVPPRAPAWHPDEEERALPPMAAWSAREPAAEADEVQEPVDSRATSLVPPIEAPPVEEVELTPAPELEPEPVTRASDRAVLPPEPVVPAPDRAAPAPTATEAPPRAEGGQTGQGLDLPITLPVTISGWLVGIGSFVGALALFADFRLFSNPITLVLLVLLLGVAATVFFSTRLPAIPYLQLGVMMIVLAGLGVALDRIGFGAIAGIGSVILLLAMIAAAAGIVIAETGRDRPWAGPGRG